MVFGRFKVKLFRNGQGAKKDLEIEMTTFTWPSWRGKVKPEWLFYTGAFQTSSPAQWHLNKRKRLGKHTLEHAFLMQYLLTVLQL